MTRAPWIDRVDLRISRFMITVGRPLLRLGLGLVFIWFGLLKPLGVSPVEELVSRTVSPLLDPAWFVPLLGWWEIAAGVCIIDPGRWIGLGRWMTRIGVLLLLLMIPGTFLSLVVAPDLTWQRPLVPTTAGQFVMKNLLVVGVALYLGGRVRADEQGGPGGSAGRRAEAAPRKA